MSDLATDRVYEGGDDRRALVAAGVGVVAVALSGARVGRFAVDHRAVARDLSVARDRTDDRDAEGDGRDDGSTEAPTADGRVAVATDSDVLLAGDRYAPTEFGPAVAVGFDGATLLAAEPDGRVARRVDGDWRSVGSVDAVRAIDGDLVAAANGVYRAGEGLSRVGLDDVRDVAVADGVLAATGDGLYELQNGWVRVIDGRFDAVAAAGGRAAAAGDRLFVRDGEWTATDAPLDGRVAGIGHGRPGLYAVTRDGVVLAHADDGLTGSPDGGWRTRSLGVDDVGALVVFDSGDAAGED